MTKTVVMASTNMCNERSFQWNDIKESVPLLQKEQKNLFQRGNLAKNFSSIMQWCYALSGFLGGEVVNMKVYSNYKKEINL